MAKQLGLQLPGAGGARKPSPNVYTALLFVAVVALGAACGLMWMAATKVAPPGGSLGPLEMQDAGSVRLASD